MKITIVNHSDIRGGASVVSRRLMHALCGCGADASMLVKHKESGDPYVYPTRHRGRLPFIAEHLRILAACRGNRTNLFKLSTGTDGLPLHRNPHIINADIVVLNWVNQGMLSLKEIHRIAGMGKKIVWVMHDMWNATGICHHAGECPRWKEPGGCHNCPMLGRGASEHDLSAKVWHAKRRLYISVPITFVAVSNWLADICRQSPLMAGCRVEVIANAFPTHEFASQPRRCRAELGLPESGSLIVMGAARLDDPIKGLPLAVDALNSLTDTDAKAVFFGELRNPRALAGLHLPYVHLGTVANQERLNDIYAHATAVLSSSLWETLPGTLVEAQASGAYPVAFDRGGQRDIITHPATGWLAAYPDTDDLARGLRHAICAAAPRDELARAAGRFSCSEIAHKYLNLFNSLYEK